MAEQNEGHRHVPIPEIIRGRAPHNIGIRPNSARCIECGELCPDHPDTEGRWQAFLFKELTYEDNTTDTDGKKKDKDSMQGSGMHDGLPRGLPGVQAEG